MNIENTTSSSAKQRALLIAEKPSLMRDIQNAYQHCKSKVSYDITFISQVGHLVELLDPVELNPIYKKWDVDMLPIDPDKEGGWKYKVKRSTKDVYKNIETEVKSGKYDVIIHAGDPDQEGELLVNLVLNKIGNKLPVLRFWSNDITQPSLEYALQHLRNDNEQQFKNLYAAALLRQHTDWSFGMNGSRAIADRIYAGRDNKIAAGRVMTWIQTAIVDREDEIKNFVPKTTYGVRILYNNQLEGNLYEPKETIQSNTSDDEDDKSETGLIFFETEDEAKAVLNDLAPTGTVISYKKTTTTTYAPKLYKLATIQMDAGKEGYSASRTLEIIQSLYEKHFVSYPRTDCEVISSNENLNDIINSAGTVVGFENAAKYALTQTSKVLGMKKFVNDKELQKHGHSALIPTCDAPDFQDLTDDERFIYTLIARRFLAIFQPPLIQDKMTILTNSNNHIFRSSGKKVIDAGYTTFLGMKVQDIQIPALKEGDILNITQKEISEKTTTCPKRFTNATLIAAMENPSKYLTDKTIKDDISDLQIGTPATRGAVIDKVVKDGYITLKKGYYEPTDFGAFMIHTIKGISLCRIDTTGHWEQILTKVRFGEMSIEEATSYMKSQVEDLIKDIKGVNKVSYGNAVMDREVIMTCPSCGKDIIAGPRNYYCSGYRDGCKYSMMKSFLDAEFSVDDIKTLFSGGIIEKTLTKKDKSAKWKQKLKFNPTEGKLDFVVAQEEETDIHCPDCHETLYSQGKKLFCKSCNFTIWRSIAGKDLSDNDLKQIIEKGQSSSAIDGFKSKTGKTFKAILKLKKNGDKSGFEFKFNTP